MENETELMAFRLPKDLAQTIRGRAIGDATITNVVVRMLRAAPAQLNYAEFHDGVRPKRKSKKAAAIEALKASDPMSSERPEIEYGSAELPSGGSVSVVGAAGLARPSAPNVMQNWRAGRKPLLKPGDASR
jgi:hypothetical protein